MLASVLKRVGMQFPVRDGDIVEAQGVVLSRMIFNLFLSYF